MARKHFLVRMRIGIESVRSMAVLLQHVVQQPIRTYSMLPLLPLSIYKYIPYWYVLMFIFFFLFTLVTRAAPAKSHRRVGGYLG